MLKILEFVEAGEYETAWSLAVATGREERLVEVLKEIENIEDEKEYDYYENNPIYSGKILSHSHTFLLNDLLTYHNVYDSHYDIIIEEYDCEDNDELPESLLSYLDRVLRDYEYNLECKNDDAHTKHHILNEMLKQHKLERSYEKSNQ